MPKPDINLNYDDASLATLKAFNQRISRDFSSHPNRTIANNVIETLMYIKLNPGLIKYAVENKDDVTLYTYTRDQVNGVLRASNDMSFHLNSYAKGDSDNAVNDFTALISSIENGITLMNENPDHIETFISYIKDSDVGCLEFRLSDALVYVGELISDHEKKIKLVNLFAKCNVTFSEKYPAQKDQLDPFLFFQHVLNFFKNYISRPVDYKNEESPLDWNMILQCAEENFEFTIEDLKQRDGQPIIFKNALLQLGLQSLISKDRQTKTELLKKLYSLMLSTQYKDHDANHMFSEPVFFHSLVGESLAWGLRHRFPEPLNSLLDETVHKKNFIHKPYEFFKRHTYSLRNELIQNLKDANIQTLNKTISICSALDSQNKQALQVALGLENMAELIASGDHKPHASAWLKWQLAQRFPEPLNSLIDQPVIVNSKQTYLRVHLLNMIHDNDANPKTLHKILAICDALNANNETQLIDALDINRGFKVFSTASRQIFNQAKHIYVKNESQALAPAIEEAFQLYYGKSFNTKNTTIKASNRHSHGIMHALGCVELIPEVHALYNEHVQGYTEEMTKIAKLFNIEMTELLTLLQHAALMHDSGRMGDGVDHWDAISAENLSHSLQQKHVPEKLIELLKLTILYKDDQAAFIDSSKKMYPGNYQFDYLRQLMNMTDTLEVIRVRDQFNYQYLPIFQRLEKKFINKKELVSKIDYLVYTTAKKIHQESRTELTKHEIVRIDGSKFLIKPTPSQRFNETRHNAAFAEACVRLHGSEARPAI